MVGEADNMSVGTGVIDVTVIRGAGNREAPDIVDGLITNERLAIARGSQFIDENWYKVRAISLRIPPVSGIVRDGDVIQVTALPMGLNSRAYIQSLRGTVTQNSISLELDVEAYTNPE